MSDAQLDMMMNMMTPEMIKAASNMNPGSIPSSGVT